jgi:hypothetical protein
MGLVRGNTLEEAWDSIGTDDKADVCHQLKFYVSEPRTLRHAHGEFLLGKHCPTLHKSGTIHGQFRRSSAQAMPATSP